MKYWQNWFEIRSSYILGDVFDEEKTPLRPHTLYGQSKKSLFELIQQIRNKKSPNTILLWPRIGYFFGDHEPKEKFLSRLAKSVIHKTPLNVMPKETLRPYAHVDYLGRVFADVLFTAKQDLVFNVTSPYACSLEDMVECVARTVGQHASTIFYGKYVPPVSELSLLKVPVERLKKVIHFEWQDTFFDDYKLFIERNL